MTVPETDFGTKTGALTLSADTEDTIEVGSVLALAGEVSRTAVLLKK